MCIRDRYWIVLIVLLAGGYFLHLKRYCKAFRHDRDALLAARSKDVYKRQCHSNVHLVTQYLLWNSFLAYICLC